MNSQASNEELKDAVIQSYIELVAVLDKIIAFDTANIKLIEKEREHLIELVHVYGDHTKECPCRKNTKAQCSCGYSLVFKAFGKLV